MRRLRELTGLKICLRSAGTQQLAGDSGSEGLSATPNSHHTNGEPFWQERDVVGPWLDGEAPHLQGHPAWGDWLPPVDAGDVR